MSILMYTFKHRTYLIYSVALVIGMIIFQSFAYAKMYRWTDKEGKIFYSDKVPPKQSKLERKVLNESGRVAYTVQAAKTREQIELEQRLETLRREQEKIIRKQKASDKVLLSTFRSVDDLRFILNGKLLSIDAQKRVDEKMLEHLQDELLRLRRRAIQLERRGNKVPETLLNEMTKIKDSIGATKQDITKVKEKRKEIENKFDKEIERFIFLTDKNKAKILQGKQETTEKNTMDVLSLYACPDEKTCVQAWEEAKQFVILNSSTGININSETLIMGNDPVTETDISLSVSKSKWQNKQFSIFLDIRCHQSNMGEELCLSKEIDLIRQSFRTYIERALKN